MIRDVESRVNVLVPFPIILRGTRSEFWHFSTLVLWFAIGCCFAQSGQSPVPLGATSESSVEKRVKKIQVQAKRIEAADEAPDSGERRHVMKELPHWQFSGLYENSAPIFLNAMFTEGQVVREESYYLVKGRPLLVRVERWWDVEDTRRAPEPATRQEFYIENDRLIRRVTKVESRPPKTRVEDAEQPAEPLLERSRTIVLLLQGEAQTAALNALRTFPYSELPKQ